MATISYKHNTVDNTFVRLDTTDSNYPVDETTVFSDPVQVEYLLYASSLIETLFTDMAALAERVTALEEA